MKTFGNSHRAISTAFTVPKPGLCWRKIHVDCRHSTWRAKDAFLAFDGMTSSPTGLYLTARTSQAFSAPYPLAVTPSSVTSVAAQTARQHIWLWSSPWIRDQETHHTTAGITQLVGHGPHGWARFRDSGLSADDAWAVAEDRSTWRVLRPTAGYAQQRASKFLQV